MTQKEFDLIKKHHAYTYIHKGRTVYCMIHPHPDLLNPDNGPRLNSLQKFFDEEEGYVYYETYEKVTIVEIPIEDLLKDLK
jgi:hypothetical protein